jgi:hypothetical protein
LTPEQVDAVLWPSRAPVGVAAIRWTTARTVTELVYRHQLRLVIQTGANGHGSTVQCEP